MYALETGGRDNPWGSFEVIGTFAASAALFVAFLWIVLWAYRPSRRELQEMRAASILEDRDA